jgi:hypothetical protein
MVLSCSGGFGDAFPGGQAEAKNRQPDKKTGRLNNRITLAFFATSSLTLSEIWPL